MIFLNVSTHKERLPGVGIRGDSVVKYVSNILYNRYYIMFRFIFNVAFIALLALLVVACSSTKKINLAAQTEAELYEKAQAQLKRNNLPEAIELFNNMERRYPFGEYSKSAQLALIYAHYSYGEPETANATANRFIRLNPQHPHIDYAYYMKGLISFPKAKTFLQRFADVDLSHRDISDANISFNRFSELVKRFPKSEYTPDALKRMEFLRNLLARHEIHVANYYLDREAFLAAVNRGQYVLQNFQQTPAVPDALAVMIQGYHKMNMTDLEANSLKTLKENYPNHPALKGNGEFDFNYSSQRDRSLISTATFGLLRSSTPPGFNTEHIYNPVEK